MRGNREGPAQLYRQFTKDGVLLYVGTSQCALKRIGGHSTSAWAHQIARIEIENFPCIADALVAERQAIRLESPRFNVLGAQRPRPSKDVMTDGLVEAIEKVGAQGRLAKLLGVKPQQVNNWLNRDLHVPPNQVLTIERLTGISRTRLRPDLYPAEEAVMAVAG